jgi:hypothetical protein
VTGELVTRFYRPGDEAHVVRLFRASFGRSLPEERWRWRYQQNPSGQAVIGLAWRGDVLVAHCAASPVTLFVGGRTCRGALVGGAMAHPDHRQTGAFTAAAQAMQVRLVEQGIAMVWGFPNSLSHRGFARDLQWTDIREVPTLSLPLLQRPTLPLAPDGVVEVPGFDRRFDVLWAAAMKDQAVITRRDAAHLRWRYAENPIERYRILGCSAGEGLTGYALLKSCHAAMQVVDLLALDMEVGLRLIAAAVEVAREVSASAVRLWLNVADPLHHALERLGFVNAEPVTYWSGRVLSRELQTEEVCDHRRWHLTMGDSDVY